MSSASSSPNTRLFYAATAGCDPDDSRGDEHARLCADGKREDPREFHVDHQRSVSNGAGGRRRLENSVYCLYVSPLKSLANDIHRNLEVPLDGIERIVDERDDGAESIAEIRHAIRHGDTSSSDRQRMLEETPHILNTTPETLAILLNSPKFREKLRTVEYVIVDEIHSLAAGKRGTHLAVSLERLEAMSEGDLTRIGCSATIEPLSRVAEFLVGREEPGGDPRDYEIVDARFAREFDMRLECPTDDLINTPREVVQERFYRMLHEHVQDHTNTLVFTNTRSGAERVLHNLRERFDAYDESNSGCHHGSLSKDVRQGIEARLKDGDLDVVTTSTSSSWASTCPTSISSSRSARRSPSPPCSSGSAVRATGSARPLPGA